MFLPLAHPLLFLGDVLLEGPFAAVVIDARLEGEAAHLFCFGPLLFYPLVLHASIPLLLLHDAPFVQRLQFLATAPEDVRHCLQVFNFVGIFDLLHLADPLVAVVDLLLRALQKLRERGRHLLLVDVLVDAVVVLQLVLLLPILLHLGLHQPPLLRLRPPRIVHRPVLLVEHLVHQLRCLLLQLQLV